MRGLKVWYALRKGLLREMFGGKPQWVKAVDGVSFDVRAGEVLCLVGESGCGKTTTGKALLGLTPPTQGDIFLEAPNDEYARYKNATDRGAEDPGAAREIDEFRRKYSLTWKETVPWTMFQRVLLAAFALAAFLVGLMAPSLVVGYLGAPFTDSLTTIGIALAVGLAVGFIGTLPPTRPYRNMPTILAVLALLALNLAPIPAFYFYGLATGTPPADPIGALGLAWNGVTIAGVTLGGDAFGLILGWFIAPGLAGGVARFVTAARQESEGLTGIRMQSLRKRLQLIFQDPYESLNPKQSVYEIVSEPLKVNRIVRTPDEASGLVEGALRDAGLRPPQEFMFRFPHELSGGQRQRVSVAASLVLQPTFIVADEPVSMLDVSIRTQILKLMMDLRANRHITYLFITHDLSLAWVLADRIAVMYLGKIVEIGTAKEVIGQPKHPYTQALISVVPSPDPRHLATRTILKGERPDPVDVPTGCRFHPRCPVAFERCGWNAGELRDILEAMLPSVLPDRVDAITVETPRVLRIHPRNGAPESLATDLRGMFAEKRDVQRAFRGVAEVAVLEGQVKISMQPWAEPALVEVAPGNAVACHLVNAPPPETATPLPNA